MPLRLSQRDKPVPNAPFADNILLVGLLHAAYATSSTGMIINMAEEVREPATQIPKAMLGTVFANTLCGLVFLIPLMFVAPDIAELIASAQPVPIIVKSAVGSAGGAFALMIPLIVLAIICGIGCTTACARCIWSFARDEAIPGYQWWSTVNRSLDVPLNAMMLSMGVQILLGLIYFGSSSAFNAFSGVGVISLTLSYVSLVSLQIFLHVTDARAGHAYRRFPPRGPQSRQDRQILPGQSWCILQHCRTWYATLSKH